MNIVVLQDHLRSGGTERQSILLARAFTAAGHPTTLVNFRPGGALEPSASDLRRKILQPCDTRLDWFAPGLVRTVGALAPNVILCMGRMANCHGARLAARLPQATVVATLRTGKPLPWLYRRTLRRAAHVVANSHEARATLLTRYGLAPDRVSTIHNSLVFPAAPAAGVRETLRASHGAGPGTTVLLCTAMFRPEKNQRALLDIVAGLPADRDWQLWLAGDGPALADCRTHAARIGLGHRVKFLGWQRDPAPLYAAADIAVHASWSEALSNFLIEAQAHGLPFVAYEAQGIAECGIPDDTAWVITRDNQIAFRERLLALAGAPAAARESLAERARAYARTTFDPARQVEAYLALFDDLRATGSSSGATGR